MEGFLEEEEELVNARKRIHKPLQNGRNYLPAALAVVLQLMCFSIIQTEQTSFAYCNDSTLAML